MPRDTFTPTATPMKPAQRKTSPLALMACGMTLLGVTLFSTSALAATDSSAANTDAATTDTNSAKSVSQFAADTLSEGHQQLASRLQQLAQHTQAYCSAEGDVTLDTLKQDWRSAMLGLNQVNWVEMGPILQNSRQWQLYFWPDKKDLVARKTRALLAGDAPITVESLAEQSIVMQGLGSVEYQLFDARYADSPLTADSRRCELMTANTAYAANTGKTLRDEWQQFAPQLAEGTGAFSDSRDAVLSLVRALTVQLEAIKDRKLRRPIGLDNGGTANPYAAESWRGGMGLANIAATLAMMERLWLGNDDVAGIQGYLNGQVDPRMVASTTSDFVDARQAFAALPDDLAGILRDDPRNGELQQAMIHVETLQAGFSDTLNPALGLSLGFNSTDGD
ncbi:imelysin family protein [Cobetia amphilecti]|uniref:imelysin family protein n=1 Tax=Cobetia amphilecti TaxID=1055104 RepID=UPI001CDB05C6|nr:imelysin family protein [Cobetia amphilecti]UBU50207.1 imelysin family protein [Cobetia amphilecti]